MEPTTHLTETTTLTPTTIPTVPPAPPAPPIAPDAAPSAGGLTGTQVMVGLLIAVCAMTIRYLWTRYEYTQDGWLRLRLLLAIAFVSGVAVTLFCVLLVLF
jgi:hypothetical protein